MTWSRLVSMELDDEDKIDYGIPMSDSPKGPDFPYGLRISLTEKELKKLKLDVGECEIGDLVDLRCFAVVTSKSEEDNKSGKSCRVELQIEKIAVENEMTSDT